MMAAIKLVRNDTGPQLRFTLTDSLTGNPINLAGATVTLHFKAINSDVLLFSRPAFVVPPGTSGVAVLEWQNGDLDLDAGEYVGEVEVVVNTGMRETIFNMLQFELREDFA
jgi:hypothetical protein